MKNTRFAFDLGTNSLGWAVYRLMPQGRPCELIDCGVRLFSDGRNPKDGQSLAAMRRIPRAARRRRDRFVQRRDWLMVLLIRHGLMPSDEAARKAMEQHDPYDIRGKALDEPLTPHQIGRALFHLNQRRGYQSNRVADAKTDDKDKGKIATGAEQLKAKLAEGGFKTLGQYYASMPAGPERQTRTRLNGRGTTAAYEIYPLREMLKFEFDAIWAAQARYHPDVLTDAARDAIREAIFHQRPLKPPIVGRCTFNTHEFRLPAADPTAQAFRIYQELANIEIEEGYERPRKLTLIERDHLAAPLLAGDELTFGKVRKLLDLGGAAKINFEESGRDRLKGDESARRLGNPKTGRLKRLWPALSTERRAEIIGRLLDETDTGVLKAWLIEDIGATPEEADSAAEFRPPEGHIRLGPTAATKVVAELKRGDPETGLVIPYNVACERAGFHHSDLRTGEVFDRLPDYRTVLERHTIGGTGNPEDPDAKRLGRVPNPTVHIGLNQLRRVINALIEVHGPPEQIVLELARDLKRSKDDKDKAQRENRKNEDANRRRAADLEAAGLAVTPANLRLLRLWEDLGPLPRLCPYSGKPISFSQVFTDEVEIEHILPFSRTLDDSMANKTLAYRETNRGKRNRSPEEAYSGADYEAIQQRTKDLPKNKAWRFKPGAMEKFEAENRDFLARQLNETRHLSKLAKQYVVGVVGDQNAIWVVTGQLTALLRARWGLNFSNVKDRDNHRHHAIDAATIGVIDRGLLNEMARRAGVREDEDRLDEITKDVPPPPGFAAAGRDFRQNVRERVQALIVSHKTEHGTGGALHEDTAYGLVDPAGGEDGNLVYRKAIEALTAPEIGRVRDLNLRERLTALLEDLGGKGANAKALAEALRAFGNEHNIRRVRLLKQESGVVVIRDKQGAPYKALIPGDNHHMDIVEDEDGVWRGFAATVFEVNQKGFTPRWRAELPGAKFVMRLHKGDMVELEDAGGVISIKRVVRISPSNNIVYLADHDQGGELAKRHNHPDDPFRWDFANIGKMKGRNCVRLNLSEIGRINRQA
jgi:CRISPR-associated endonuclease Csn1